MSLKSLREAILEIIFEMSNESLRSKGKIKETLKTYARQLEIACRACGEDAPGPSVNPLAGFLTPETQHAIEVEKAKKEFRKDKKSFASEESLDGEMVEVCGGPVNSDDTPTYQSIDMKMPVGAFMGLAGAAYKLCKEENGKKKLVYDVDETEKMKGIGQ